MRTTSSRQTSLNRSRKPVPRAASVQVHSRPRRALTRSRTCSACLLHLSCALRSRKKGSQVWQNTTGTSCLMICRSIHRNGRFVSTSAPMATGCMRVATCTRVGRVRSSAGAKVREQRVKWSATLPYQSHWPRQECSDGSATVATWSTWQIRRRAHGRGRVQNQKCSCTRETHADWWSSRAAFDSQAAHCSSRNVWVACNGAASQTRERL